MTDPTIIYLQRARSKHRLLQSRARGLPPEARSFANEALTELSLACTMLESVALRRPVPPDGAIEAGRVRTEMVEGLMQEAAFYRGVVENLPTGLAVVDADCHLSYTNPAGSDALGFSAGELRAASAMDLVHPDDLPVAEHEFHALFDHPERRAAKRLRVRRRDGDWIRLEVLGRCARETSPVKGIIVASAPEMEPEIEKRG